MAQLSGGLGKQFQIHTVPFADDDLGTDHRITRNGAGEITGSTIPLHVIMNFSGREKSKDYLDKRRAAHDASQLLFDKVWKAHHRLLEQIPAIEKVHMALPEYASQLICLIRLGIIAISAS